MKYERLVSKIVIFLEGSDKGMKYIYNIENLTELNLNKNNEEEDTGFLEIGNKILVDDLPYKITCINFKLLSPKVYPEKNKPFDYVSSYDHTKTNSAIHVFVEPI